MERRTVVEVPEVLVKQEVLSHWFAEGSNLADGTHLDSTKGSGGGRRG
jgi:hypothetical protein